MYPFEVKYVRDADVARYETFLKKWLGDRYQRDYPDRFQWLHGTNIGTVETVLVAVMNETQEIVGQTCAMPVTAKLNDATLKINWSVDTFVLPEVRGMGVGSALQQRLHEMADPCLSLLYSDGNQKAKSKAGAIEGPRVTTYLWLNDLRLDELLGFLRKAASKLRKRKRSEVRPPTPPEAAYYASASFALKYRMRAGLLKRRLQRIAGSLAPDIRLERETQLPAAYGKLWEDVRQQYDFAVERSNDYLTWKYAEQPGIRPLLVSAYGPGGELAGCLIAGWYEHLGIRGVISARGVRILETLTRKDDDELVAHLVLSALNEYEREGLRPAVILGKAATGFDNLYQRLGFRVLAECPLMCNGIVAQAWENGELVRPLFTLGDQDTDAPTG
jgi:GNAT superfamily N-acetyltransferase